MAGISSKAAGTLQNKIGITGKELQNKEFSDGSGLEVYDFGSRMYDGQIGRWNSLDSKADLYEHYSPYSTCFNNTIRFYDADGRIIRDIEGNVVFVAVAFVDYTHPGGKTFFGQMGYIFANDGTKILAYKNIDKSKPGMDYDCHGFNFADSKLFIENNEAVTILNNKSENYKYIDYLNGEKIIEGDIVIYANEENNVKHSMKVSKSAEKFDDIEVF